ncbi:Glutaredoxin [Cynara cardunculus var. scolymus]|uniref:Glutaredoxin n=1 Tax=Cynara cardunculus var. scolymus TaxID=59895 RepID=A0A103YNX5_CYNCS|nr:Glutaredoxin [Cynara cardunculus var. scolymus]
MAMVEGLVAEKPVVIFSKSSCCMCHTIKTLIYSYGVNPTVYELDSHPNGQQLERQLNALGCKPSVPAVFVGQDLIGGAKEMMTLHMQRYLARILTRYSPEDCHANLIAILNQLFPLISGDLCCVQSRADS